MNTTAHIPAEKTFDLPTGNYRAVLMRTKTSIKQTRRGPQKWVRLLFEVQIPSVRNYIPCAGRNFLLDLNPGSDLRNFLEVWLGADFFRKLSNQDFDLETLIGKEGDICLSHILSDEYDKPLVVIDNIFPVQKLKLTEEPPLRMATNPVPVALMTLKPGEHANN